MRSEKPAPRMSRARKRESWVLLPTVYEDAGLSGGTLARCGKDLLYPETVDASVEVRSVGLVSVRVTPSPLHDYRERSAKYGTVGCDGEPYTWRRQPWKWRMPSFASSPCTRGAPQRGLALLIFRISSRISGATPGRPGPTPSALPSPISSEPTTVPADDRLRFHDDEDTLPVSPDSAQQHPKQALLRRSG